MIRTALVLSVILCVGCGKKDSHAKGERFVPASDPALLYSGRWDRTDPARPRASWPGFSVSTDFQGQAIQVRMNDSGNYYNVEVDGKFQQVVGGQRGSHLTYLLADNLGEGIHRVRLQRRNINFNEPTEIEGFVVDEGARLTLPEKSRRKRIEFIGDSYTVAEGNEAVAATLPWEKKYPVTNFAKGYASLLGDAMDADVIAVCRSGSGALCTWKGEREHPMGERYGWTQMESPTPAWTFDEPAPDLVVISLGLNDRNGLKGPDGTVSPEASAEFREAYRRLIAQVRQRHPKVRIVELSPFPPWARENISAVVAAEKAAGNTDVFYAQFDEFPGGYVSDGHPTVETHRKMAAQILDQLKLLGVASDSGALREP
ncbi:MAG: SGNH/GDSL hydrolase family protein [Luteolibacter sp.]|uniref:SGNH/GDSL hydrolase family protein n=1 Tax=Luteolibacter sp. TaxID=1962973 RepID=UPI003264977F